MRKIIRAGMIQLLCLICLLCGCGSVREQLAAPSGFTVVGGILFWSPVEHSSGYVVFFSGRERTVETCSYDLAELTEAGEYTIEVMALGGEGYEDSAWSSYVYTVGQTGEDVVPTAGLSYTRLADGSGYEVSRGNADLTGEVVFPDEYLGLPVKKISEQAFSYSVLNKDESTGAGCNTVTEKIRLPQYLEEIGARAFEYCVALQEIEIPDSVRTIGEGAFQYDIRLERAELPKSLTALPAYTFCGCAFAEIALPPTLHAIGTGCFSGCKALQAIDLPEGVEEIGASAFSGCEALERIALPERVKRLESGLFRNCTALGEIAFPADVEYIGGQVFDHTAWYQRQPEGFVVRFGHLIGYKGRTMDGNWPAEIERVVDRAFSLSDLETAVLPRGVALGEALFRDCKTIREVTLPDGMTELTDQFFRGCTGLQTVHFPRELAVIGKFCFYQSGIVEMEIPEGVTEVKDCAFLCPQLQEIAIPSTLVTFGAGIFSSACASLYKVTFGAGCTFVPENLFFGVPLREAIFPASLVSIGANAFCKTDLRSVTLPEGVEEIGAAAFCDCKQLKEISLPGSLTGLGRWAFAGTAIERIEIPGAVRALPDELFSSSPYSGCDSLTEVILGEGVETIGNAAFRACKALRTVRLPRGLLAIGRSAFEGCALPDGVELPASLVSIGARAFSNTALGQIVLPDSVTEVGTGAFSGCKTLKEIVVPASLGKDCAWLRNTASIERIFFKGTREDWSGFPAGEGYPTATVYYYAARAEDLPEGFPQSGGAYWHFAADGKTPEIWTRGEADGA